MTLQHVLGSVCKILRAQTANQVDHQDHIVLLVADTGENKEELKFAPNFNVEIGRGMIKNIVSREGLRW